MDRGVALELLGVGFGLVGVDIGSLGVDVGHLEVFGTLGDDFSLGGKFRLLFFDFRPVGVDSGPLVLDFWSL